MRYILSSFLTFGFWLLLGLLPALAQEQPTEEEEANPGPLYHRDEPMRFFMASEGGSIGSRYWISAQGMITKDTPKAFKDFLRHDELYREVVKELASEAKAMKDPNYQKAIDEGIYKPLNIKLLPIHIHSCGGDEKAAMELGRIAKTYHLSFVIGQTFFNPDDDSQGQIADGECNGACLLTAWGRSYDLDTDDPNVGNYPLHSLPSFRTSRRLIESYARQMGVDIKWLRKLLPQKPNEVRFLTAREAVRLGIDYAAGYLGATPPPSEIQRCRDIERFRIR